MTFNEWLDAYYSGTQFDDETIGMMRSAFEAGESCSNSYNDQHELLGIASELCYRVEADMPTLRDKFAMAALQGLISCVETEGSYDDFAECAYKHADAMLKERVK